MEMKPVALVTGSGRGIGRGIALALAENGFAVAGNDVVFEPGNIKFGLFEVQQRMSEFKAKFLPLPGDVSNLEHHQHMLSAVLKQYGRIDVLVNNAGVAPEQRLDILETKPESYDRLMSINARGPFFLSQKVARQMIAQVKSEPGTYPPCIIFISSVSSSMSSTSRAEYCISKAAVSHISTLFADRLTEFGINVFEIRPGIIMTEMTAPVKVRYDLLIAEGAVPQRRWGFPEDVGKAVIAIVRGYFPYSTGQVFEISGGMNIRRL